MPGWRVHEFIDWIHFGKVYGKIHRKMDKPYYFLGRSHRVLFHDYTSAYLIAKEYYPDDPFAVMSAYYHIYYDEVCSEDREYKKTLENLEALNRKQRMKEQAERRKAENIWKKDPVLARLVKDMKKLQKAKKWRDLYRSLG